MMFPLVRELALDKVPVFDAHHDDPEFGYRFLADEVRDDGFDVSDRVVWRIRRDHRWVFTHWLLQ